MHVHIIIYNHVHIILVLLKQPLLSREGNGRIFSMQHQLLPRGLTTGVNREHLLIAAGLSAQQRENSCNLLLLPAPLETSFLVYGKHYLVLASKSGIKAKS